LPIALYPANQQARKSHFSVWVEVISEARAKFSTEHRWNQLIASRMHKSNRFQYSFVSLSIAFAVLAVGLVLYRSLLHSDDIIARDRIALRFQMILSALMQFGTSHGRFPSDELSGSGTSAINSWRFQLVPYLESGDFSHFDFTDAWNSSQNRPLATIAHPDFCFGELTGEHSTDTNVMAVIGIDTLFSTLAKKSPLKIPPNAIVLVDVAHSNTHWMSPGDVDVDSTTWKNGHSGYIGGALPGYVFIGFADGRVWCLRRDVPFKAIQKFATITECTKHDRHSVLGRFLVKEYSVD
jgi:hypothetical protein